MLNHCYQIFQPVRKQNDPGSECCFDEFEESPSMDLMEYERDSLCGDYDDACPTSDPFVRNLRAAARVHVFRYGLAAGQEI